MRKTYRYRDLIIPIAKDSEVKFTVEMISDGNKAQTLVYLPNSDNAEIEDSGTAILGTGADVFKEIIVGVTDVANLIPEEDSIKINYMVNDELVVEHINLKSEDERAIIILYFKFIEQ